MFADQYFERSKGFKSLISERPGEKTGFIVVIPCLIEPDILSTLRSLRECTPIQSQAEVIILINQSENCSSGVAAFNESTYVSIQQWIRDYGKEWLRFYVTEPVRLPSKWAGVGLARKAGMDEALYRFNLMNKPDGIIVSLDADTVVEKNYLEAIENHFREHPADVGVTIRFSHPVDGLSERHARGILLYEKYLYYYREALIYAGYPHALYTVGSAFAVTADAYLKRGGMTRRKAGEDFYFLQTLTQTGHVGHIPATCVYPSARVSQRVPFGTGPAMKKWMDGYDDLLHTYNFQAFEDLKIFFDQREYLFRSNTDQIHRLYSRWPEAIRAFWDEQDLTAEFEELGKNCRNVDVFKERFYQVFNAFRILKFLNFSHPKYYDKVSVEKSIIELKKRQSESL